MNSRSMRWTPEQLDDFKARTGVKIKPYTPNILPAAVKSKPSKYGAKKTIYNGRKYDSAKEAKRAQELQLMLKAGEIWWLKEQVRYKLEVNGQLICEYVADFVYQKNRDGAQFVVEDVKGMRKGAAYQMFRLKSKLMKAIYGIEVVEI